MKPTLLITLLATATTTLGQARFVPLGDLPGGLTFSEAFGLSADGRVVVGQASSANLSSAFRWTEADGMVDLGDLPGGAWWSTAHAVSADGSVVVGSSASAAGSEPFLWTEAGGMVGLGFLPGLTHVSIAYAVSADGAVVVGFSSSGYVSEAFRWTAANGMTGLGQLPGGGPGSAALGVSADGSVIVGTATYFGPRAFRWTSATGMVDLGLLPNGGFESQAFGVNGDGSVVVGSGGTPAGTEAYRWTAGTGMVGLGDLPGGMFDSAAKSVSDNGVVVGHATTYPREAFLWTQATGMLRLEDHLVSLGATGLDGWTLIAESVSADGNAICGCGANPAGNYEAWVAYLSPPRIGDSYCGPAIPNSTGLPGATSAFGSVRAVSNDVLLVADQLPPGEFGYFLAGRTQGFFIPPGASGILCLAGNIGRFDAAAAIVQGPTGSVQIDLGAVPVNPPTQVLPGDTWNFQCWFRDASTSNFTDAISVTFF